RLPRVPPPLRGAPPPPPPRFPPALAGPPSPAAAVLPPLRGTPLPGCAGTPPTSRDPPPRLRRYSPDFAGESFSPSDADWLSYEDDRGPAGAEIALEDQDPGELGPDAELLTQTCILVRPNLLP